VYRTPPKYCPTPSGAPSIRVSSLLPSCFLSGPAIQSRCISRIWLSRARATRIRAGDERNSEFRMCERLFAPHCTRRGKRERKRERETPAWSSKGGITMPKRARIVVRPADTTDNSQCAKCIGIESGRFIFAPTQPGPARFALVCRRFLIFACIKKFVSLGIWTLSKTNDTGNTAYATVFVSLKSYGISWIFGRIIFKSNI